MSRSRWPALLAALAISSFAANITAGIAERTRMAKHWADRDGRQQHPEEASALAAERARPAGSSRPETGPRLKENLEALYAMIDGVDAAPTSARMRYYAQLQARFRESMQKLDALLKNAAAQPQPQ